MLRKARREPAFAARLTWPRRLLMALDAAKGMLYLHSHRPAILHRDLKSPNLLVARDWRVQVRGAGLVAVFGRARRRLDSLFLQCVLDVLGRPQRAVHGARRRSLQQTHTTNTQQQTHNNNNNKYTTTPFNQSIN